MPHDEQTITIPATDGRTIAELKAAEDYEEFTVKEVEEGFDGSVSITTTGGSGFGINAERVGDWERRTDKQVTAGMGGRIYPGGLGTIHGIDLDGTEVYWKTPAERAADRANWLAGYDRDQREEFARDKDKLDADYAALPDPLKGRIDRFRDEDEGFRVTSEGYELFCCTEAAKFFAKANDAAGLGYDSDEVDAFWTSDRDRDKVWGGDRPESLAAAWLLWVWTLDYERQERLIDLSDDHSGNTFGSAMMLAVRLAQGEEV